MCVVGSRLSLAQPPRKERAGTSQLYATDPEAVASVKSSRSHHLTDITLFFLLSFGDGLFVYLLTCLININKKKGGERPSDIENKFTS